MFYYVGQIVWMHLSYIIPGFKFQWDREKFHVQVGNGKLFDLLFLGEFALDQRANL